MRPIDADALKANFQDELCGGIACSECSLKEENVCKAERWIDIQPTIEAEPVKHGRWKPYEFATNRRWRKCSVCGTADEYINEVGLVAIRNYCPNCGAKMDGGNNDSD